MTFDSRETNTSIFSVFCNKFQSFVVVNEKDSCVNKELVQECVVYYTVKTVCCTWILIVQKKVWEPLDERIKQTGEF